MFSVASLVYYSLLGQQKIYIFWPIFKIENGNVVIIEGEIFANHLKICFSFFQGSQRW
jgi:hypothetical protein